MADTAQKITQIVNPITAHLAKRATCQPKQRDYKAKVYIQLCDDTEYFHELVCSKAITLPSIENESIEVEDGGSCNFSSGILWKEYTSSSVYGLSEFSVELDYTLEKYKLVRDLIMTSRKNVNVVIEANDDNLTQLTFTGKMKGGEVNHSGRNDATLSTINVSIQPSGEPLWTEGVRIPVYA